MISRFEHSSNLKTNKHIKQKKAPNSNLILRIKLLLQIQSIGRKKKQYAKSSLVFFSKKRKIFKYNYLDIKYCFQKGIQVHMKVCQMKLFRYKYCFQDLNVHKMLKIINKFS